MIVGLHVGPQLKLSASGKTRPFAPTARADFGFVVG